MKLVFIKRMEWLHPFFLTLFGLLICCCLSHQSIAQLQQTNQQRNIQNIPELIFDCQFQKANIIISTQPLSYEKLYLQNISQVLEILTYDQDYILDQDTNFEKLRISQCRSLAKSKDETGIQYVTEAEIHFHWAVVKFLYGQEGSGAWSLKRSYDLLEKSKKSPNSERLSSYHHHLEGVFNSLLGNAPEKYKWMLEMLGYSGNSKEGKDLLMQEYPKTHLFYYEHHLLSKLLLSRLYGITIDEPLEHPPILLDKMIFINQLMNEKKYEEAQNELGIAYKKYNIPHLYFLKAQLDFYNGKYKQSILNALQFQYNTQGKTFIKYSNLLLFYNYSMLDQPKKGIEFLKRVLEKGNEQNSKDRTAQKFSLNFQSESFNYQLLKARLLFDSGDYKSALSTLKSLEKEHLSLPDQLEYHYRLGRINQEKGHSKEAIHSYQTLLKMEYSNSELPETAHIRFLYANSSYHLGILYRTIDKNQSKTYLLRAIDYKNHEYENDIEFRAKIALKSLNSL